MKIKRFWGILAASAGILLFASPWARAANTYTVAMDVTNPADGYTFMRENPDQIALRVTNTGDTLAITSVKFVFVNATFNTTTASTVPAGWSRAITNTGAESSITFTATGGGIGLGGAQTFPVSIKGHGGGGIGIPAAASDVTDSLLSMTVLNGGNAFALQGSFPSWTRHGLKITSLDPNPTTISGGQNTTYTITVQNVSSGTKTVSPSLLSFTGTGSITYASGPAPASASLAGVQLRNFTYEYTGSGGGTVTVSATASATGVTAPSFTGATVLTINTLAATIKVDPMQVPSGYLVTVSLSVTNTGTADSTNVVPGTVTTAGTATKTLTAGPTPASISALPGGTSSIITWEYMITGTNLQTYGFTSSATADAGQTSGSVSTNPPFGNISTVYATVTPNYMGEGSTNQTLEFECFNSTGQGVKEIRIRSDSVDFVASSAQGGYPTVGTWSFSIASPDVIFTAPNVQSQIPSGSSAIFRVTYASFPQVINDMSDPFNIRFTKNDDFTDLYDIPFSTTSHQISLIKGTARNLSSQYLDTTTVTATVTNNGTPASGVAITWAVTQGKLSSTSTTTDGAGQTSVTYSAPSTLKDVDGKVTASQGAATESIEIQVDGTRPETTSSVKEKL